MSVGSPGYTSKWYERDDGSQDPGAGITYCPVHMTGIPADGAKVMLRRTVVISGPGAVRRETFDST